MKRLFLVVLAISIGLSASAFCGFYVAKADADLFNESSQVIIARDNGRTVITMSNDYKGPIEDFAMVVPVPTILEEQDIRIANQIIFDKLDAYSGPRLVEYYDYNPCQTYFFDYKLRSAPMLESVVSDVEEEMVPLKEDYQVTIEAKYAVGEYDILILSAKESDGLQRWLTDNGYQIPTKAETVLEPYIKSNMKFFVVKVNVDKMEKQGEFANLNPLQIEFESDKFMLPIRLGMANANGPQDMIVYAFSRTGRVETTNYRTEKLVTDIDIPTFVKDDFGKFYVDVFEKQWATAKDAVQLEYAWDLRSTNFVKCDPCPTQPPTYSELDDAGVFWVDQASNQGWNSANYVGDVFITRLHVRYDREHFPQDLQFQITPNKENFQCRYVMNHPATGDFDCDKGKDYLNSLIDRRRDELFNLAMISGWNISHHSDYVDDYIELLHGYGENYVPQGRRSKKGGFAMTFWLGFLMIIGFGISWKRS